MQAVVEVAQGLAAGLGRLRKSAAGAVTRDHQRALNFRDRPSAVVIQTSGTLSKRSLNSCNASMPTVSPARWSVDDWHQDDPRQASGRMFWFMRKKFVGSYWALIC